MIYQYSNYHTFHVDLLSPYMNAGTKTCTGCCRTQMRTVLVYSECRAIPRAGLQLKPLHSRPFLLLIPNIYSVLHAGPHKGNWVNHRQKISMFLPEKKVHLVMSFPTQLKKPAEMRLLGQAHSNARRCSKSALKVLYLRNTQLPWADGCSCRFHDASAKTSGDHTARHSLSLFTII